MVNMSQYPKATLYSNLITPSVAHSYSLGVSYMQQWFLTKFQPGYIKNIHMDGKNILDDFRTYKFEKDKVLKIEKPNVSINPHLQFDWDREKLDSYPYGANMYLRKSNIDTAFFKDPDKNIYLGFVPQQLQINIDFKIRVATRLQQIDLYNNMNVVFRIGYTQGEYVDLDMHIPSGIILQIAAQNGFEITDDNKIVNQLGFMNYLNSHSLLPILFKFRADLGTYDYFLRLNDCYMHIACPEALDADDGERVNMIYDNFSIVMSAQLQMPSIKAFLYYSVDQYQKGYDIEGLPDNNTICIYDFKSPTVPEKNSKGWNQIMHSDYFWDDLKKPLEIDFTELLQGDGSINTLLEHNKSIGISPEIFLDFKLFNNGDEIKKYTMDWNTFKLTTSEVVSSHITSIYIYIDLKYVNEQIAIIKQMNNSRFS